MVLWHVSLHLAVFALWALPPFWDGKHYFFLARHLWAPGLVRIGRCKATFIGGDKVDWTQPHIIVANHSGNSDIPLLMMLVPRPLRFLAKRAVGMLPFLGWMLHLAGFPFIDREQARRGRLSLAEVARRVREEKMVVAIFPEGTRSPEGTVLPFKKGAFLLAIQAGVPVVPVAIEGSGITLARGAFRIYPTSLRVTVGEPVPTTGLTTKDRDALCARVEAQLVSMLRWRRIAPAELPEERKADLARRRSLLAAGRVPSPAVEATQVVASDGQGGE